MSALTSPEIREGRALLHELGDLVGHVPTPVVDLLAQIMADDTNGAGQVLRFLRTLAPGAPGAPELVACSRCSWEDLTVEMTRRASDGAWICSDVVRCTRSVCANEIRSRVESQRSSFHCAEASSVGAYLSGMEAAALVIDEGGAL